jgi:Zn-dependent peptidase ImmA (M78 family)/uncharacterized protein YcgL (UPF0745 family)
MYISRMSEMPIHPELLAWAMNDMSVDAGRLAHEIGKPERLVQSWLSGERKPHQGDLTRVAKTLGRSTQFFFLRRPPERSEMEAKFRSAVTGSSSDPAAELRNLRSARAIQQIAEWWVEQENVRTQLPPVSLEAAEYASIMREFLAWDPRTQVRASSKTAAFRDLREAVEETGIVVLLRDMGENNCRGFSLPNGIAPVIAINSAYKLASLRSYTLLHELAHVAKGTESVCHDGEASSEERWCDRFAAAFLMPENHLRAYFASKGWTSVPVEEIDRVRLISNRYKASWQSVGIRLRELGLAPQSVVDEVFSNSREADGKQGFVPGGKTTPVNRYEEFGSTYTRAILGLRNRDQLTEIDARKRLNVDKDQLAKLTQLVSRAS